MFAPSAASICTLACRPLRPGGESMSSIEHNPLVVDEPNWRPLEMALAARELQDFMYMGHSNSNHRKVNDGKCADSRRSTGASGGAVCF